MNDTLENVMVFINENTNILIGICLFLILVLVAYLIDNSIKTRKIKKSLKSNNLVNVNKMVEVKPVKIEKNNTLKSNVEETLTNENINQSENNKNNEFIDIISDTNPIDDSLNDNIGLPSDNKDDSEIIFDNDEVENKDETQNIKLNTIPIDTIEENNMENKVNADIMKDINNSSNVFDNVSNKVEPKEDLSNVDVIYKNDKKLSEILSSTKTSEKAENIVETKNIFDTDKNNIQVDTTKKPSDIEIEQKNDELDNIMKKLENINAANSDEDSYTNIF